MYVQHIPFVSSDERESYVGAALHGSVNSSLGAAPSAGGDKRGTIVNTRATRLVGYETTGLYVFLFASSYEIRLEDTYIYFIYH